MIQKHVKTHHNQNKVKLSRGDIVFNIINYTVFLLITIACVFPFYYLFINTISSNEMVRLGQIQLVPHGIHFENYVQVMKIDGIMDALLVSVARTVLGTIWTVGRLRLPGLPGHKTGNVAAQGVVPADRGDDVLLRRPDPLVHEPADARLPGQLLGVRHPGIVSPYNVILVKTFIEGLPPSLEESATLDGAGYTRVFLSVVMPLITPILATLCIFSAVGQWNSFTDTMMLMPSGKYATLQFLLYKYQHEAQSLAALVRTTQDANSMANLATKQTSLSVQMTVAMVVTLPILMVYPFFQRYFVKGIMIGAVKG